MCDHGLLYRHVHQLQQRRPLWRCGTCGRVAYRPLDCCARPAFTSRAEIPTGWKNLCWGRMVELWRRIGQQGLWQWCDRAVRVARRRCAVPVCADDIPMPPVAVEDDHAETMEVANTPVGVGERG
jgi:hypothetical protein